ncbi:hypothetical protein HDU97_008712 [Phlyctochytrium planicorne]|nr:hypothetical protein HDU97_008712 [Phlyctochytrium planicorne]
MSVLMALPYAFDDVSGVIVDDDVYSNKFTLFSLHVGAMMGFRDAMQFYNISSSLIDLVTVNTWDPKFAGAEEIYQIDSGGYSTAAVYDAIQSLGNVVGIFGEFFSKTTKFTAGLVSEMKKPFCGGIQGSITLSNKQKYPYFWRMMSAKGEAKHFARMYSEFGAKTVCIFTGIDDFSMSNARELISECRNIGMNTYLMSITDEDRQTRNFKHYIDMAKVQKCHFIFGSMPGDSLSALYVSAINNDPDTVNSSYFGIIRMTDKKPPMLTWPLVEDTFWDFAMQPGVYKQYFPELNLTGMVDFYLNQSFGNARPAYNCMMTMFAGFAKALQKEQNSSFENLPTIVNKLDYSAFGDTGYVDPWNTPVALNEYGDFALPKKAFSVNETNYLGMYTYYGNLTSSDSFGFTSLDAKTFTYNFTPKFYDYSPDPPRDEEPPLIDVILEKSVVAIIIRTFQALGGASTLASLILMIVKKFQKLTVQSWSWVAVFGGGVAFGSTFWIISSTTPEGCFAPTFMFLQSHSLIFGSAFYFLMYRSWIYFNTRELIKDVKVVPLVLSILGFEAINAIMVIAWRFSASPSPTAVGFHPADYLSVCSSLPSTSNFIAKAFIGLWNLLTIIVVAMLLSSFKDRGVNGGFDNILKIACISYIAILVFEFILTSSPLKAILQTAVLNLFAVVVFVILLTQKVPEMKPQLERPGLKRLVCTEIERHCKARFMGSLGWEPQETYRVLLCERSSIPWMIMIPKNLEELDIVRVDLRPLRSCDIITGEDEEAADPNVTKGKESHPPKEKPAGYNELTHRSEILLILPKMSVILRMRPTEPRRLMVKKFRQFAEMNERRNAQVVLTTVGQSNASMLSSHHDVGGMSSHV